MTCDDSFIAHRLTLIDCKITVPEYRSVKKITYRHLINFVANYKNQLIYIKFKQKFLFMTPMRHLSC